MIGNKNNKDNKENKLIKLSDHYLNRFNTIKKAILDKVLECDLIKQVKSRDNNKSKKLIPLFIKPKNSKFTKFCRIYFLDANEAYIIKFFSFVNKVVEINTPIDLREILGEQDEKAISEDMLLDFENKEFKKNSMFFFTYLSHPNEHNYAEQFYQLGGGVNGVHEENFCTVIRTYPKNNILKMVNELLHFRHLETLEKKNCSPSVFNEKIIQEITVFNKIFIRINEAIKNSSNNSNNNNLNINEEKVAEKIVDDNNKLDLEEKPKIVTAKTKKGGKKKKNKAEASDSEGEVDVKETKGKKVEKGEKAEVVNNVNNINDNDNDLNRIESRPTGTNTNTNVKNNNNNNINTNNNNNNINMILENIKNCKFIKLLLILILLLTH